MRAKKNPTPPAPKPPIETVVTVEQELRDPTSYHAYKADYGNSRLHAIHMHCRSCMGGATTSFVRKCELKTCFLWPYRAPRCDVERPEGMIPTAEEYVAAYGAVKRTGPAVPIWLKRKRELEGLELDENEESSSEEEEEDEDEG